MVDKISKKINLLKGKQASARARKTRKFTESAKSTSYQAYLVESLKDPEEAAGYLNAALSGGDIKVFLLALQNVVQGRGGVAMLSEKTHKSRTSLYKSLSEKGNPYLKSANEVLIAMDMHLAVIPKRRSHGRGHR